MSKYGPDRKELWFRIWASLAGLVLLVIAIVVRGMPEGPAFFEVFGVAGLFLLGSLIWAIIKLRKLPPKD